MKVIITCYFDDDFKYNVSKWSDIGDAVDEVFEGKCSEFTIEVKREEQRLPRLSGRLTGLAQERKQNK